MALPASAPAFLRTGYLNPFADELEKTSESASKPQEPSKTPPHLFMRQVFAAVQSILTTPHSFNKSDFVLEILIDNIARQSARISTLLCG